jgi:hypothetical protein
MTGRSETKEDTENTSSTFGGESRTSPSILAVKGTSSAD